MDYFFFVRRLFEILVQYTLSIFEPTFFISKHTCKHTMVDVEEAISSGSCRSDKCAWPVVAMTKNR